MTTSKKERLRRALAREPVDRLPTQISYTGAVGAALARHFGVPLADVPARLGNHLRRVDLSYPKRRSADGRTVYDWWGAGWDTKQEGYFLNEAPLAESNDLDAFAWPDTSAADLLAEAARTLTADNGEHFVVPNFGFCLFERAWSLRGFDTLLMDIALDPDWVGEMLDRITDVQVALARRFVALGVDGGYFGDDYGAQKGLLISPASWRRLVKPRLARQFAAFREAGLPVIMHTDGDIAAILPDLVEIGLTCLNPVQPEVLDHAWLKRTFGGSLAFYGGVSTQTVLPYGTPDEVRAAARECIRTLAGDGTGLLLAPSHRLASDVPMANVEALLDVFTELE